MTKRSPLVVALLAVACGTKEPVPPADIYPYVVGGSGEERVRAVAPGADGEIVIAGTFAGTLDFGLETVDSAGNRDIYVVVLEGSSPRWIWTATDDAGIESDIMGATAGPDGSVYALVRFAAGADLGGGWTVGSHAIVKLDRDGAVAAVHDFGGPFELRAIVAGADGRVFVAVNAGVTSTLLALTGDLEVDWQRVLETTGPATAATTLDLAVTPDGDVIAYGAFSGTLALGDGTDPLVVPAGEQQARFVARFAGPATAQAAMLTEADTSIFVDRTVAVDPDGGVHLGGDFWTVLDDDLRPARETPLDGFTDRGELHVFADGTAVWRGDRAILWLGDDGVEQVRVEADGADALFRGADVRSSVEVIAVGDFAGEVAVSGVMMTAHGGRDLFVTRLPAAED